MVIPIPSWCFSFFLFVLCAVLKHFSKEIAIEAIENYQHCQCLTVSSGGVNPYKISMCDLMFSRNNKTSKDGSSGISICR